MLLLMSFVLKIINLPASTTWVGIVYKLNIGEGHLTSVRRWTSHFLKSPESQAAFLALPFGAFFPETSIWIPLGSARGPWPWSPLAGECEKCGLAST